MKNSICHLRIELKGHVKLLCKAELNIFRSILYAYLFESFKQDWKNPNKLIYFSKFFT